MKKVISVLMVILLLAGLMGVPISARTCDGCNGSGILQNPCIPCRGRGSIEMFPVGDRFSSEIQCTACGGLGYIPCQACNGSGQLPDNNIPANNNTGNNTNTNTGTSSAADFDIRTNDKGEKYLYLYMGKSTNVVIPDNVQILTERFLVPLMNGAKVPGAADGYGPHVYVTSVTIPSSVTKINSYAFYKSIGLQSIIIPSSVTLVYRGAFANCTALKSVVLSENAKVIWDYTFSGCTKLNNVVIPDGIDTISNNAFEGCTALKKITIPPSVKSISDSDVFKGCSKDLTIHGKAGSEAEKYAKNKGINFVADPQFDQVSTVPVPTDTPTNSESAVKDDFTENSDFTINGSVLTVYNANSESVNIPKGVESVGKAAFKGNITLKSVYMSEGVTSIEGDAFSGCSNLMSVFMPSSMITIDDFAFFACKNLKNISIPQNVTTIGRSAFGYCTGLIDIHVYGGNSNYSSQNGVLFDKNKTKLIVYPVGKTDKSYVIPDTVTEIDSGAFGYSSNLTDITIPDSVSSIGYMAFYKCTNLTSIVIPDGVTNIGIYTFNGCTNLTSVTIPSGVTKISDDVFSDCPKLTVYGEVGSYAESYAKKHSIKFSPLKSESSPVNAESDTVSKAQSIPPLTNKTAKPTASTVLINFKLVNFDAYNIDGSNYFKLRDLAYALNDTEAQFQVGFDSSTNTIGLTKGLPYTSVGGEMSGKGSGSKIAVPTTSRVYLNGKEVTFIAYNIDGNNYFKLRDIGQGINFNVTWDSINNAILINTDENYEED